MTLKRPEGLPIACKPAYVTVPSGCWADDPERREDSMHGCQAAPGLRAGLCPRHALEILGTA